MLVKQFHKSRDGAASGLRVRMRATMEMLRDKKGIKIMAYVFLLGLVALAAVVSYDDRMGIAVADMRNVISAIAVAFMQQ